MTQLAYVDHEELLRMAGTALDVDISRMVVGDNFTEEDFGSLLEHMKDPKNGIVYKKEIGSTGYYEMRSGSRSFTINGVIYIADIKQNEINIAEAKYGKEVVRFENVRIRPQN